MPLPSGSGNESFTLLWEPDRGSLYLREAQKRKAVHRWVEYPIRMITVGSIIPSSNHAGRMHVVTGVHSVGSVAGGSLQLVQSTAVGKAPDAVQAPSPAPTSGQDSSGAPLVDPRLLLQAQEGTIDTTEIDPQFVVDDPVKNDSDFEDARVDDVGDEPDDPSELVAGERRIVNQLRQIQAAVRQEEATHAANAGQYASAPQYEYVTGPDGQAYAVSGHVDVRAVNQSGDADETERLFNVLSNAALSPNAPSGSDLQSARDFSLDRSRVADAYGKPGERSPRPGAFAIDA